MFILIPVLDILLGICAYIMFAEPWSCQILSSITKLKIDDQVYRTLKLLFQLLIIQLKRR